MKKAKIGILLSVLLVMITVATCFAPVHVSADEHTYARASEKIQVYSQNDGITFATPNYPSNPNWLNYNGCGWFAIGHALQWLQIIGKDSDKTHPRLVELFENSHYLNSVNNFNGCIQYLQNNFSNLGYEKQTGNVEKIVELLSDGSGKVVILHNYRYENGVKLGHIVTAVDVSSDGQYIHIIDSNMFASKYNGAKKYYLYNASNNTFESVNLEEAAVGTVNHWYAGYAKEGEKDNGPVTNKKNQKLYAGGDYWLWKDDFFTIGSTIHILWSKCTHFEYNTATGKYDSCFNLATGECSKCGAIMPSTTVNCTTGLYKTNATANIRSNPYPLASVTKTVEKGTYLEVGEAVINQEGRGNTWYKVWYDGQYCGYIDSDQVKVFVQSGNIEEKSYYLINSPPYRLIR